MFDDDPALWPEIRLGAVVPWSGEVLPIPAGPIELPIPPIPQSVPVAGPVIHFIGEGEHAVWDNVWGWIKGEAHHVTDAFGALEQTVVQDVVTIVEHYVGTNLQAFSGFINQAFDYTNMLAGSVAGAVVGTWDMAQAGINYLDSAVYTILADVVGIDNIVIPGLEAEIARLGIDTWNLVGGAVAGVETWAIDNIYVPVLDELVKVDANVRADVWGLVGSVADTITGEISHLDARTAAEIAALAATVAATATWVAECGAPMCDTVGPNTDLGKLFKALKLAGEIAALSAILNMTEAELVALIRQVVSRLAAVVGDVEQFVSPGGETVAGLIANAAKDLV